MAERESKGVVVVALRNFTVARFGERGWQDVLGALSREDAEAMGSAVAIGWYPTAAVMRTFDALDRTFAAATPTLWNDYGRFAAESDLNVFNRLFLRMASPAFVIEKVGDYWGRFHTHGRWEMARHDQSFTATLQDFERTRTYCLALTPYIRRLLELVGAKGAFASHPSCRSDGAATCVFLGGWR